jgi:hypothetical protein
MCGPPAVTVRLTVVAALLGVMLSGPPGAAQIALDRSVNMQAQQTGRMLDANPQIGARGLNSFRPVSPLMGGNLSASGLLDRGMSLRSVSPIPDVTAFRAPLGSGALYEFRRDSVGLMSSPLGSGSLARPYYDPATTVVNPGFLQGLAGLTPERSAAAARPLDLRVSPPSDLGVGPVPVPGQRLSAAAEPPARVPQPWEDAAGRATFSSIFGPTAPPRVPLPPAQAQSWERATPEGQSAAAPGPTGAELGRGGPPGPTPPAYSTILRNDLYPRGVMSPAGAPRAATPQLGVTFAEREPSAAALKPLKPRITDPSVLPGYDVYTDMQLAVALLADPNAAWFGEMQTAAEQQPELAQQFNKQVLANSAEFVDKMLHTPLQRLSGSGASELNDQLLKAEALMDIGHYAEAAERYAAAQQLAPQNPLPPLGKGHALLASGQYRSAALAILQALTLADRTPGVAAALFRRLDLSALLGGGEVVDLRRADLLKQLAQRETPELRFLLGYLEYHTGDDEHGLANLRQAAENPLAGDLIARYPALLTGDSPAPE